MRPVKPTVTVVGTLAVAATTVIVVVMQRQFQAVKKLLRSIMKIERAQLQILADEAGPDPTGPNPILQVVK